MNAASQTPHDIANALTAAAEKGDAQAVAAQLEAASAHGQLGDVLRAESHAAVRAILDMRYSEGGKEAFGALLTQAENHARTQKDGALLEEMLDVIVDAQDLAYRKPGAEESHVKLTAMRYAVEDATMRVPAAPKSWAGKVTAASEQSASEHSGGKGR